MLARLKRYSFTEGIPKKALSTPYFTIRFQSGKTAHMRCAVVVSKKVDGRATYRNNIKRKIMQIVQEAQLDNKKIDIVFYTKKPIQNISQSELEEEIYLAFKRMNIL